MDGEHVIPPPLDDDDDDVAWALQTAAIQWQRGQRADAVVWLRRAVDAAITAGNPARTRELTRLASEVADRLVAEAMAAPDSKAPPAVATPDSSDVDDLLTRDPSPPPVRHRASQQSLTNEIPIDFEDEVLLDDDDAPTIPPAPRSPGSDDEEPAGTAFDGARAAPGSEMPDAADELFSARPAQRPESEMPVSARDLLSARPHSESEMPVSARDLLSARPHSESEMPVSARDLLSARPGRHSESPVTADELFSSWPAQRPESDKPGAADPFSARPRGTSSPRDIDVVSSAPPVLLTPSGALVGESSARRPPPPSRTNIALQGESERPPREEPRTRAGSGRLDPESDGDELDLEELRSSASGAAVPEPKAEVSTPSTHVPSGASLDDAQSPGPPVVGGISLDRVRGFEDLPEPAQLKLAASATLTELSADEEIGAFGAALVTRGKVGIMPSIADVAASVASEGEVVFTRGTLEEAVSLRVVALEDGTVVASWSPEHMATSMADCPWVADDLRLVADRFQAFAGATLGPLGDRLDDSLRGLVMSRLDVKAFQPGETIVAAGKPVPGLHVVGAGRVEIVNGDGAAHEAAPGDFLFAAEVLAAGKPRATARAGKSGALVLFAPRAVAHELMMSVPPLLEILGS